MNTFWIWIAAAFAGGFTLGGLAVLVCIAVVLINAFPPEPTEG